MQKEIPYNDFIVSMCPFYFLLSSYTNANKT